MPDHGTIVDRSVISIVVETLAYSVISSATVQRLVAVAILTMLPLSLVFERINNCLLQSRYHHSVEISDNRDRSFNSTVV